jgi:hypothetical protein
MLLSLSHPFSNLTQKRRIAMSVKTMKQLTKKLHSLEKKYEKVNPKAVLAITSIERLAQKYTLRIKNLLNRD